jgi:hypothetical protein
MRCDLWPVSPWPFALLTRSVSGASNDSIVAAAGDFEMAVFVLCWIRAAVTGVSSAGQCPVEMSGLV